MRVYLDLCCLKRPFDLQDQPLVRVQTEAVLSILALPTGTADLVRSQAQRLENSLNPVQSRWESVDLWLAQGPIAELPEAAIERRIEELLALGFKSFDAFHLASAELASAAALVTVDTRFLRLAARHATLAVAVVDPVQCLEELTQWKPSS